MYTSLKLELKEVEWRIHRVEHKVKVELHDSKLSIDNVKQIKFIK